MPKTPGITEKLGVNFGARWDILSGFSNGDQVSLTINFFYQWRPATRLHAGFANTSRGRIFRRPPRPCLPIKGTSGAVGVGGKPFPEPERNYWDAGFVQRLSPAIKLEQDNYFRLDRSPSYNL